MQTNSLLQYLMSDETSLRMFMEGEKVTYRDVVRRMVEQERSIHNFVPDHYYRLLQEKCLGTTNSLAELLTEKLPSLANEYLEEREKRLFVKAEKQNEWQLLLPKFSPLLLLAAKMFYDNCLPVELDNALVEYYEDWVLPNVKYTALPHPFIFQLEDFRDSHGGMYDLHIHLNGTMEADVLWHEFLAKPIEFHNKLTSCFEKPKVKELFEQFSLVVRPDKLLLLAGDASFLKMEMYNHCFHNREYDDNILRECMNPDIVRSAVGVSPMDEIVAGMDMQKECLFYIYILSFLKHHPGDEQTALLFYFYIQIKGLLNRLFVMQSRFYGFEEFNKYTLSGIRKASEKFEENCRYLQLAGNELDNIRMMEGRFAPSGDKKALVNTIGKIIHSWKSFNHQQDLERNDGRRSELSLIAHFIKSLNGCRGSFFFEEYRLVLAKQVEVLISLKKEKMEESNFLVGIDAASSEFSTPPEVFSQAYRLLRKNGFVHFTFHAGEDFFHLLGGIRAVWEAIEFLNLQRGDRIGHAAALGVSAELWRDNIGEKMLIRKGEYLDDLVFAYFLIEKLQNVSLLQKLPLLTDKINNLCFGIYGQYYSPFIQVKAWLDRYESPNCVIGKEASLSEDLRLFRKYLEMRGREDSEYDEIIEIDTCEFFNTNELSEILLMVLREMHDKEIVIETLPTSNVMIGHHHSYSSYHLYNWYKWGKLEHKPIPPIVLGSDDAGIFATNIFNEYCNVYCQLMYDKKLNSIDVIKFIEELDYNSKLYSFRK